MRFLILSDIHGNYHALDRVLKAVEHDALLCCGDIVVDYPFPEECVRALKDRCAHTCMGNNDDNVAFGRKASEHVGERYAHLAGDLDRVTELTAEMISDGSRKYLRGLPRECRFVRDGISFYMNHTAPGMPLHHYLDPDSPRSELARRYREIRAHIIVTGHTHIPYVRKFKDSVLVNPGSVGEPRDGDPRASFATLDTETGRIDLGRIEYDRAETGRVLRELGFPDYSLYCLRNGSLPDNPGKAQPPCDEDTSGS